MVPTTLLVNVMAVALPEQIFCEEGVTVNEGAGLMVTVAVAGLPTQVPTDGVIV